MHLAAYRPFDISASQVVGLGQFVTSIVLNRLRATAAISGASKWRRSFRIASKRPDGVPGGDWVAMDERTIDMAVSTHGNELAIQFNDEHPLSYDTSSDMLRTLKTQLMRFLTRSQTINPMLVLAVNAHGQRLGLKLRSVLSCQCVAEEFTSKNPALFSSIKFKRVLSRAVMGKVVWWTHDDPANQGFIPIGTRKLKDGMISILESDWEPLGVEGTVPFNKDNVFGTSEELPDLKTAVFYDELTGVKQAHWPCQQSDVLDVKQRRNFCVMLGFLTADKTAMASFFRDRGSNIAFPKSAPAFNRMPQSARMQLHCLGLYPAATTVLFETGATVVDPDGQRRVKSQSYVQQCLPGGWAAPVPIDDAHAAKVKLFCEELQQASAKSQK